MATTRFPWRKEFKLIGKAFQFEFSSGRKQVIRLCEAYHYMLLTERTRYLNVGYWADGCDNYDDACEAMVDLLGKAARLSSDDVVLDAGFGYGDQDFRWLETTDVARIVGINITPLHIREARAQAHRKGMRERVEFIEASATDLPFAPNTFDKVVSLESPLQFETRHTFLEQTYRVLRPGGLFAATEILPLEDQESGTPAGRTRGGSWFTPTPSDNWHSASEYSRRLTALGFTDVTIESIREHVYEPWRRYMAKHIDDPEFKARISRLGYRAYRSQILSQAKNRPMAQSDYVVVVARKPESTAA